VPSEAPAATRFGCHARAEVVGPIHEPSDIRFIEQTDAVMPAWFVWTRVLQH
jgi:hypothetical protein